eukprot:m.70096 g.70096  ORF g.70096 m.70096 type:complete len:65 (+) comp8298_c2_seq1:2034-2228(+)
MKTPSLFLEKHTRRHDNVMLITVVVGAFVFFFHPLQEQNISQRHLIYYEKSIAILHVMFVFWCV